MKHCFLSIQLILLFAPATNSFSSLLSHSKNTAIKPKHADISNTYTYSTSIYQPTSSSILYLSHDGMSSDVVVSAPPKKKPNKINDKNGQLLEQEKEQQSSSSTTMKYGMLISSFPDGVQQKAKHTAYPVIIK